MFSARELGGDKPRPYRSIWAIRRIYIFCVVGAGLVPAQLASGKMNDANKIRPQTGLVSQIWIINKKQIQTKCLYLFDLIYLCPTFDFFTKLKKYIYGNDKKCHQLV